MSAIATAPPALAARPSAGLFRFAVFFAVFVLLHIKGGAMVTSTGSGMAFTDWPLARGSLWPPGMDAGDLFEHVHRVFGTAVGLFAIVLWVWIRRADPRRWLRRLAFGLLVMIVIQGVLGGLGVRLGSGEDGHTWWPAAVGHGVLAQPTLCVAVLVAFALSNAFDERVAGPAATVRTARKTATFALGLVFVQLVLGAIVRHTNVTGVLWLHVVMAMVVSLGILIAASYSGSRFGEASPGFRKLARWTFVALLVQLTLGFATLAVRRFKDPSNIEYIGRSLVASSHVIVGASLFLLATLLVARTYRNLIPTPELAGDTPR